MDLDQMLQSMLRLNQPGGQLVPLPRVTKEKEEQDLATILSSLPSEARQASFPPHLQSPVLHMAPGKLNIDPMETLIMTSITKIYSQTNYENELEEYFSVFKEPTRDKVHFITILPIIPGSNVINKKKASEDVERTLKEIPEDILEIRIVRFGISHSQFLFDAIKYIVQQIGRKKKKKVHVVTTGDSNQADLFNLCRVMCLSEICEDVSFYNISSYQPFGHFKE